MNWNQTIRQVHRWLSMAFTAAVIINVIALMQEKQAVWVGMLALLPLVLLLISGIYLFALPYAARWRRGRGVSKVAGKTPKKSASAAKRPAGGPPQNQNSSPAAIRRSRKPTAMPPCRPGSRRCRDGNARPGAFSTR